MVSVSCFGVRVSVMLLLLYRRAPPLTYSRHKSNDFKYYVFTPSSCLGLVVEFRTL